MRVVGLWQAARMQNEPQLALIDTDRRRLVRAATRLLGPGEAEDAVQDAYVRALEADAPALNTAQAWLLTVLRNLAVDRLRRRQWMQQWLAQMTAGDTAPVAPSAETDASLAQEAERALRLLAIHLTPADGAALLLHEVFEVGHSEIALASGRSEASSRQQLRRALLRLRQSGGTPRARPHPEREPSEEVVLRLFMQSLLLRDPQALWATLRQSPIKALAAVSCATAEAAPASHATSACSLVQVGGQLGLVLTLDGVRLCVLPLGVRPECQLQTEPAQRQVS